jgi:leader peptidase (prepilin peptidase) / N-methyltransferase
MLYVWVGFAFVLGAIIGSFINVCVARLPFEKSILWPASRCGRCLQPIRFSDNIPIIGYWLLRGRCRACGQPFSVTYSLVELFTACTWAGLFYLEIGCNVLDLPYVREHEMEIAWGAVPPWAFVVFLWHATLVSFLIVTSLSDLQHLEVPLGVTVCGTLVGLVGATFMAWPFPKPDFPVAPALGGANPFIEPGLYPWPVWPPKELPSWLPLGSWQLGLATGLAGALAGMVTLRAVRFLFGLGRGKEGLGIGDADVMMMAGSFIGWQPTLVAFFVGVFVALFFGIVQLIRRGDQALPFGPALAVGAVLTLLAWPEISRNPIITMLFSESWILGGMAAVGAVFLLLASFALRILRGPEPPEAEPGQEKKAEVPAPQPVEAGKGEETKGGGSAT